MSCVVAGTRDALRNFDAEQKRISGKPVRDITEAELSTLEFLAQYAARRLADEGQGYVASSLVASARNLAEDLSAVRRGGLSVKKVRLINSSFLDMYDRMS